MKPERDDLLLFVDCSFGVSGDMLLAALFDLGVPVDAWRAEMEKLALPEKPTLEISETVSCGLSAKTFSVIDNSHHHHSRGLSDLT